MLAGPLVLGGCQWLLPFGVAASDGGSVGERAPWPRLEQSVGPGEQGLFEASADHRDGSSEAGPNWLVHTLPGGEELTGVWGASEQDVWVVGKGGVIYHFDGKSWSKAAATEVDLYAVHGHGSQVLAVGANSRVVRNTPAGWVAEPVPLGYDTRVLRGVAVTAERAYAVGTGGLILERAGGFWTTVGSQTSQDLLAVASDGSQVIAVGKNSVVLVAEVPAGLGTTSFVPWTGCKIEPADLAAVALRNQMVLIGGRRTATEGGWFLASVTITCFSQNLSVPATGLADSGLFAYGSAEQGMIFRPLLSSYTVKEEAVPDASGVTFNAVWASHSTAPSGQVTVFFAGTSGTVAVLRP